MSDYYRKASSLKQTLALHFYYCYFIIVPYCSRLAYSITVCTMCE